MMKLRVWWIPQVPCEAFYVYVKSVTEGVNVMNILAEYDAFQFENKIKPDYANAGGLHVLDEDGEWVDWWDEETATDDPYEYVEEKSNGR